MTDTVIAMKRQIFNRIKYVFSEAKDEKDGPFEPDDDWVNRSLQLYIKDNTPTEKQRHG